MNRGSGAAARLRRCERKALAARALTGSESITKLADELKVSHKFVCAQSLRAGTALTEAFWVGANDEEKVLFKWVATPQRLERGNSTRTGSRCWVWVRFSRASFLGEIPPLASGRLALLGVTPKGRFLNHPSISPLIRCTKGN